MIDADPTLRAVDIEIPHDYPTQSSSCMSHVISSRILLPHDLKWEPPVSTCQSGWLALRTCTDD